MNTKLKLGPAGFRINLLSICFNIEYSRLFWKRDRR